MIVTENMTINGKSFIRTYSDIGFKVERDGVRYDEAIDPEATNRTYTETTERVDTMTETEQKAQAYDILTGVSE